MIDPDRLFSLTRPCRMCPFLSTLPFSLDPGRVAEIAESIRRGEPFTCHKTIDYSDDDPDVNTPRARACAGAIGTLENAGAPEQQTRQIARRIGMPVAELAPGLPLFADLDEWVAAMTGKFTR